MKLLLSPGNLCLTCWKTFECNKDFWIAITAVLLSMMQSACFHCFPLSKRFLHLKCNDILSAFSCFHKEKERWKFLFAQNLLVSIFTWSHGLELCALYCREYSPIKIIEFRCSNPIHGHRCIKSSTWAQSLLLQTHFWKSGSLSAAQGAAHTCATHLVATKYPTVNC